MLSRALSLATVMLAIGCCAADVAQAQNLEAGKSAAQIFSGTCTACHKSPRGLLKTVAPGSLPGFLRQHYTTSPDMAKMLSGYLVSNGAADTRYRADTPKQHPGDEKQAPERAERHGRKPAQEEAARPDETAAQDEPHGGRKGRHGRRMARPDRENPEGLKPGAETKPPKEAAGEHEGRKRGKQKLTKRGRRGVEEPPKADSARQEAPKDETLPGTGKSEPGAVKDETAKSDAGKDETPKTKAPKAEAPKAETSKTESPKEESDKTNEVKPAAAKSDASKPDMAKTDSGASGAAKADAVKSEAGKPEAGKSESGSAPAAASGEPKAVPLRADPVPAVTPAPKSSEGEAKPSQAASPPSAPESPAASQATSAEPAKPAAPPAKPVAPPPSMATSAPAGPPVPPISK